MMNQKYLNGTICAEDKEKICHLTVVLDSDNLFENVYLTPLNQTSPYQKEAGSLAKSFVAEIIVNHFMRSEDHIMHKKFAKTDFYASIFENLYKIRYGQTFTYKELASMCGYPQAARAVGNALCSNPLPIIYPCHRIVAVNGLGGFSGNHKEYIEIKKKLLELEQKGRHIKILP